MNMQNRRKKDYVTFGSAILMTAFISFASADDAKTIPDHSSFQSCKACHAEKSKAWEDSGHGKAICQSVRITAGATDCGGCHTAGKAGSLQQNAAAIPQESHHKEACLACHSLKNTEFKHRVFADPQKLCSTCHFQSSVFLGEGAKGIDDSRNFHSGVLCAACHMTEGNHAMKIIRPDDPTTVDGKRKDTCTACHMDNNRESRVKQIHEWQSTYEENMPPLLADVKAIEAARKKNPALLSADLQSKFDDVKTNLSILEKDGSRGFHNFVFMLQITSMASSDLKKIKAAIPK
jgi:hypothetical protein